MTITDSTIEITELAYQHKFDDYEKQMIREIVEKVAWEGWFGSVWRADQLLSEQDEKEMFNEWINLETEK